MNPSAPRKLMPIQSRFLLTQRRSPKKKRRHRWSIPLEHVIIYFLRQLEGIGVPRICHAFPSMKIRPRTSTKTTYHYKTLCALIFDKNRRNRHATNFDTCLLVCHKVIREITTYDTTRFAPKAIILKDKGFFAALSHYL